MKTESGRLESIRIRIMSEAYDLADRDDSEGYNSVKVMCSDVLAMIETAIAAEREACAKLVEPNEEHRRDASWGYLGGAEGVELLDNIAEAIRARGEK